MKLTDVERERVTDSMLKIQSVRANLEEVDLSKIPHRGDIEACLNNTDKRLRQALGYSRPSDS